jgi:hypothetical protein
MAVGWLFVGGGCTGFAVVGGVFLVDVTDVCERAVAGADMCCERAGDARRSDKGGKHMRAHREFAFWVLLCMGITSVTYLLLAGN